MPRVANPQTRVKLLDAAERLMLRSGFAGTSVDDICSQARLTKGSFFHYFDSKQAVAAEATRRFYNRQREAIRTAPFRRRRDPLKRVYGYIDFMIAASRDPAVMGPGGCLIGNMAQELAGSNPSMRRVCGECFRDWAKALRADLAAAKKRHAPGAQWNPGSLADHCVGVIEGAILLAKSAQNGKLIRQSLRHLKRYLMLLFENE